MAENTSITWCDHTFNPWIGCTKVSPACDHCYAEAWDNRFGGGHWGAQAPRRRTTRANWWKLEALDRRAGEEGVRRRVFCASLADVFDNQVDPAWRADLWALIDSCRNLDWLLLTKRPQNIHKMLPVSWGAGWPHVWLGTTAEDQQRLAERAWALAQIPASVRFLSVEPMLGPLNVRYVANRWGTNWDALTGRVLHAVSGPAEVGPIHWVICGGESGQGARPMHPDWARSLRDQCAEAGTAFFFKQWGEWVAGIVAARGDSLGHAIHQDGAEHCGKQNHWWSGDSSGGVISTLVGTKASGDLLDGRRHQAWPAPEPAL